MCAGFVAGSPLLGLLSLEAQHQSLALTLLQQKPRNRADWEARFLNWQRPASETEEEKIEAAKRRVSRALKRNAFLSEHPWQIVPQGSYHNNTNVRSDSDVDLAIALT